jgi:hypothetical protein
VADVGTKKFTLGTLGLPGEYFMYGTPLLEGQEPEGVHEMQQVLQQAASENY